MNQGDTPTKVPLDGAVRPASWRREWDGDDSDLNGYVHCDSEHELDGDGPWEPLYDQASIDTAVAAERERCARLCETAHGYADQREFGGRLAALIRRA